MSVAGPVPRSSSAADADLAFAVLLVLAPGEDWTLADLAEVSGLSLEGVRMIERRALRKVLRALQREGWCRAHTVALRGYRTERVHRRAPAPETCGAEHGALRAQDGAASHAVGVTPAPGKESIPPEFPCRGQ